MKDPVCGMEVHQPPVFQMLWNNTLYGFCNLGCMTEFKAFPEKYFVPLAFPKKFELYGKARLPEAS